VLSAAAREAGITLDARKGIVREVAVCYKGYGAAPLTTGFSRCRAALFVSYQSHDVPAHDDRLGKRFYAERNDQERSAGGGESSGSL
jgi:hypothetical protein